MKHLIKSVDKGSPAEEAGIHEGAYLLKIDGSEVVDVIDYEQLTCTDRLLAEFELEDGSVLEADIEKDMYAPLGLNFESALMSAVRQCKNHCIFCFIDQMHTGGRKTLHFKDDDWRLSLIMGNYVTLTNVDDEEFERIIKRRVSPLYISVHATDGEIRKRMMRNPTADIIMQRLSRLKEEKLRFHAQIVLCPEINDGEVLKKTVEDLYSLYPAAESVAVVPVGLTKHREGLYPLRCLTRDEAREVIVMTEKLQERFFAESGTRFVFCSDEMYVYAKMPLPAEECFEDYPQIENGVGLLRKFEYEFINELEDMSEKLRKKLLGKKIHLHGATGVSAYSFLQCLFDKLERYNIKIELHPIRNDFFGETVTVAGLTCAQDIAAQLVGKGIKQLIIPATMLRENDDVFLDGVRVHELEKELDCEIIALPCYDGGVFLKTLVKKLLR